MFAQRAIASAHRAARRGAELTGKLLAFSRRQTLLPAPIRIPELLSAFRDLLARTLGPNIEIIVTTDPELPLALADSGQLETALLNLAVNARDAMPAGGKLGIEASEVVLEAIVPGLSAADARQWILQRNAKPWTSLQEAAQALGPAGRLLDERQHAIRSRFFEIQGRLRMGSSVQHEWALVEREGFAALVLRLRAEGITEDRLLGIRAPLGIPIGSRTVPEIAISIVAELIATRSRMFGRLVGK